MYFIIRQGRDLKLGIGMLKQAWEICWRKWEWGQERVQKVEPAKNGFTN